MRIGETITHNGIEAVLVKGTYIGFDANCKACVFFGDECMNNNLSFECDVRTPNIFKQVTEQ